MIRTAPIVFTTQTERWSALLRTLGCTVVVDAPGWRVMRAGRGVVALHDAPAPRRELWFESDDPRAAAEATGGDVAEKPADGQPDPFWMSTMPDGMTLGFSQWVLGEGDTEGADERLAVLPLWTTPDVESAAAALVAAGAERRLSSDNGDWADLTLTDGLAAVHRAEGTSTVLSFEWAGELERLTERLASHGFDAALIDESYGRTLRLADPDGGDDLWVNERQSDLYGYREG